MQGRIYIINRIWVHGPCGQLSSKPHHRQSKTENLVCGIRLGLLVCEQGHQGSAYMEAAHLLKLRLVSFLRFSIECGVVGHRIPFGPFLSTVS